MNSGLTAKLSRIAALLAVLAGSAESLAQSRGQQGQSRGQSQGQSQSRGQGAPQRPPVQSGQGQRQQGPGSNIQRQGGERPSRPEGAGSRNGGRGAAGRSESEGRPNNALERPGSRNWDGNEWRGPERSERRRQIVPPDVPAELRPLPRLRALPRNFFHNYYWERRYFSLQNSIMFATRKGFIPVTPIPEDVLEVTDFAETPVGWRGYGIVVPPWESLSINLEHPNRGWFRLIICDAWGQAVPGGLSSKLPQFEPRLTYSNNSGNATAIYLIVDDPGWMSSSAEPYILELSRSWNHYLAQVDQGLIKSGIWGIERSINAKFRTPMFVMPGFK